MDSERLNIADKPADTECRRVRRIGRKPNAARIKEDQPTRPAGSAKVTQVLGRPAWAARYAYQRRAVAEDAVADLSPVVEAKAAHFKT